MAPKKKAEEKLQAVVLCDSYQTRFMPLVDKQPRCLLPLCNVPLIEYTLEFLANAGVGDVYVVCGSHSAQIEAYMHRSKWMKPESPLTVRTMAMPDAQSVGDVMRHLDSQSLLTGDFVLINGDVVTNMNFHEVLKHHKETKAKDKDAIMTMVLREANSTHRTRQRSDPGLFILAAESGQCLRYESARKSGSGSVLLDAEVLNEHGAIEFRNDLIDCRIDICTLDVAALFTENFDYDNLREHFVRGILTTELLGKHVYTHVLTDQYAARVHSPQTYDAVSKDVIARYSYPLTLDNNLLDDQVYSYQRGHIYKERGVILARSCTVGQGSVLGSRSSLGDATVLKQTVVGRDCVIGNNVRLCSVYVWDGVTIEDNVEISNAIIGQGCVIKAGAKLGKGSILGPQVVIGQSIVLPKNTLVAFSDTSQVSLVGPDGNGVLYKTSHDEDDSVDEDQALDGLAYELDELQLSDSSFSGDDDEEEKPKRHNRTKSLDSRAGHVVGIDEDSFVSEARASLERAIEERHATDVASLELNTLRMTMNASYDEVREATMGALVTEVTRLVNFESVEVKTATNSVFVQWLPLIKRQIFEHQDQVDLVWRLQCECAKRPLGPRIFVLAVVLLYNQDVVEEDYIRTWYSQSRATSTRDLETIHTAISPWIKWLDEADEESDEESDLSD